MAELVPRPAVHPNFAPLAALASPNEHGAAAAVKIALLKRERFTDPQPRTPQQHDQGTKAVTVGTAADRAHNSDDLLNSRRIGRILLALVRGGRPR